MLKRGLYKSVTGELVWLMYELDGKVTYNVRSTGKTDSMPSELFTVFYVYHSEFK